MDIVSILVLLILVGLVYWAVHTLASGFGR